MYLYYVITINSLCHVFIYLLCRLFTPSFYLYLYRLRKKNRPAAGECYIEVLTRSHFFKELNCLKNNVNSLTFFFFLFPTFFFLVTWIMSNDIQSTYSDSIIRETGKYDTEDLRPDYNWKQRLVNKLKNYFPHYSIQTSGTF